MKKRLLPALLALVMVLTMLPLSVFGAGEVTVVAANLTAIEGKQAPAYGHATQYTATLNGQEITVKAHGVEKTENTNHDSDYWVGVGFPYDANATYAWGFGTKETFDNSDYKTVNRTQITSGQTYTTLYWSSDKTADEGIWTEDTGYVSVKSGDQTTNYTVKFEVTIGYQGYTLAEWISDMQGAIAGISISGDAVTLNDTMAQPPVGAFLLVYANMGVFEAVKNADLKATDDQGTAVTEFETALEGVKKIDASCLNTSKLIGMGTLSPYKNLEELDFSGNQVSANNVLDGSEMANWTGTLTKLNLSNTGVTDISVLQDFTKLVELNLSNNAGLEDSTNESGQPTKGITALQFCTKLTTLDISNTGITRLDALKFCTKLTSLKATNLQNVNLLGLAALVNEEGFNAESLADGAFVFTGSTKDNTLTKAERIAVNKMIDDLGSKATGLTKYDIVDDTPVISVTAANLTGWSEGKPEGENADTYTVTKTGDSTIAVTANNLQKHANASGDEGYWVGVAITKLDGATYEWKFKEGTPTTKTTQQLVDAGRVQGEDEQYVTLYWSTDDTTDPWSETEGEVTVTVGGQNYTYTVNFTVTVAEEPPALTFNAYYQKASQLTGEDAKHFYGGKLEFTGLTPGKWYVVTFDYGAAITGGQVPRAAVAQQADADGRIAVSCQETMKVGLIQTGETQDVNGSDCQVILYDSANGNQGILVTASPITQGAAPAVGS